MEPISHDELMQRAKEGSVTVLDVRPPAEYAAGHLPGTVNIPLAELEKHLAEFDPEHEIVAYFRGPYASSAGPAVTYALGSKLTSNQLKPVVGWINVGGILRGSPLVDHYSRWPRSIILNVATWWNDWSSRNIKSMSTAQSRKRFATLSLPSHITIVNYLGIPVSGSISRYSQDKYPILQEMGPNDGLTLITDAIAPNSVSIISLGTDHFFAEDPDINLKTVAAIKAILRHIENQQIR